MKNFDVQVENRRPAAGLVNNAWHNTTLAEVFTGKEPQPDKPLWACATWKAALRFSSI
jgi:hypothetical protein